MCKSETGSSIFGVLRRAGRAGLSLSGSNKYGYIFFNSSFLFSYSGSITSFY